MPRIIPLIWLLSIIALIALLHILALNLYLYFYFWWLDLFIHFLGGAWVALACLWLLFISGKISWDRRHSRAAFIAAIMTSFIIGLGWEAFEYWSGLIFVSVADYARDTVSDLIVDVSGGAAAALYFTLRRLYV